MFRVVQSTKKNFLEVYIHGRNPHISQLLEGDSFSLYKEEYIIIAKHS